MIINPLFNTKYNRPRRMRSGTTLIEAAIGLWFICTVILGCIDFSIATMNTESLNYLAHRVGRAAIIHGKYAQSGFNGGPWGPLTVTTTLDGTSMIATIANQYRGSLNASAVTVSVSWPSGNNSPGSPVLVQTSMVWAPAALNALGYGAVTLTGTSYQIIQH